MFAPDGQTLALAYNHSRANVSTHDEEVNGKYINYF